MRDKAKLRVVTALGMFLLFFAGGPSWGALFPLGLNARSAAMGGVGVASVADASAALVNPAGMQSRFNLNATLGAAPPVVTEVVNLSRLIATPSRLISEKFSDSIDINGGGTIFSGFQFRNWAVTTYGQTNILVNKAAGTTNSRIESRGSLAGSLTTAFHVNPKWFPLGLNLGASVKSVYVYNILGQTTAAGTIAAREGTGMGLDVGATASLGLLRMGEVSVGMVGRDLFENVTLKRKNTYLTFSATGSILTQTEALLPDVTEAQPASWSVGAAVRAPLTGTFAEADIDFITGDAPASVLHVGVEHPFAGILKGRIGMVTGSNVSFTGIGLGIGVLDIAYAFDGRNAQNNQLLFDLNLGR